MPSVDPFVKAEVPGRRRAPLVAASPGYRTLWIPPTPHKDEMCAPVHLTTGSAGLFAGGGGPVGPELLAVRSHGRAHGGEEMGGVDGAGQLVPLDLLADRVLHLGEDQA